MSTLETGSNSPNDFDLFKSQYSKINASEDEVVESEEYCKLNQFLSKEGWISHVAKLLELCTKNVGVATGDTTVIRDACT